jgi:hypothetical protein
VKPTKPTSQTGESCPQKSFLVPALCFGLAASHSANAQSQWTTADDFVLVPGFSSSGLGLGTNGVGDAIAVGYGAMDASGTTVAVTRESSDLGQSWQTASVVNYPGATALNFRATANKGQTLYAAAEAFSSGGSTTWMAAQSEDGGSSWGISDSFQLAPNEHAVVSALAVDESGNVFAGGYATATNQQYFIIRKLAHGTSQWSTVYQAAGGMCSGFAIHPTAGIFAVGHVPYGSGSTWLVLQSSDGGSTWKMVDNYAPGLFGRGFGIGCDSRGALYATGQVGSNWATRRSTDAGRTWSLSDNFNYLSTKPNASGGNQNGYSVTFDYQGNVYVAGAALTRDKISGTAWHWVVRELPVGRSSWIISDDFQLTTGQSAYPSEFQASTVSAASGHLLLVTGEGTDAAGVRHWITRRLVVP